MFGDYLIKYVARLFSYLLNVGIHSFRYRGSGDWRTVKATVSGSPNLDLGMFSSKVEISYTYSVGSEPYAGVHVEPFLLRDSPSEYASRFPQGTEVFIRVKPNQASVTILRDEDQWGPSMKKYETPSKLQA